MDIITFANQIIDLRQENLWLKTRVEELEAIEKKYDDLVKSSLGHTQIMGARQLEFLLSQAFAGAKAARLGDIPCTILPKDILCMGKASSQICKEGE